jgi:predicted transcriptional regulator
MQGRKLSVIIMVLLLACFVSAGAEEKFGIKVYDGAKYDASTSKSVSDAMHINASCYRTNDSVAKVVEFFKKQPGLNYMGGDKENGMFKKGDIDITIQNPWMDMKTGNMMKDTLISIVKQ